MFEKSFCFYYIAYMNNIYFKIDCFEYSIDKFVEWYQDINGHSDGWKSNFTKLKLIKLNFFLSAVNANDANDGLLDIFDNFYAMPYGHIEFDIYNHILNLHKYNVSNTGIDFKHVDYKHSNLNIEVKAKIDSAIESLKIQNNEFVNYGSFKLVELSHQWYSWINMYNLAKLRNETSIHIPLSLIKNEGKLFII